MDKHSLAGGVLQINPFLVLGWSVARPGVLVFPALQFSFVGSCFLSPLFFGSGFGLPGLIAIFFLHLDMFPLVSTYNAKKALFLKSKVC